jgi:hypothetical protein
MEANAIAAAADATTKADAEANAIAVSGGCDNKSRSGRSRNGKRREQADS